MEQFEPLGCLLFAREKRAAGGSEAAAADRAARALGEDVGAAHEAKVADQPVQIGVADRHTVDIDHRFAEPDRLEQRRERRTVNAGVKARARAAVDAVGGDHGLAQARKTGAADDRAEQQTAGAKHMAKRECRGLDIVGRFQFADRQAQIDACRRHICQIADANVGHDRRQPVAPLLVAVSDNRRRAEAGAHVREPIEAIVECAMVEEIVAVEARGALAPQGAGMIVEQRRFHTPLVQGCAGGNKGAWRRLRQE